MKTEIIINRDFLELMPLFVDGLKNEVDKLNEAIQSADSLSIGGIAHDLKALGGTYQIEPVTDLGRRLETSSENFEQQVVESLIRELGVLIGMIERKLHQIE